MASVGTVNMGKRYEVADLAGLRNVTRYNISVVMASEVLMLATFRLLYKCMERGNTSTTIPRNRICALWRF